MGKKLRPLPEQAAVQKNYGHIAERRVDEALRVLVDENKIHFGFRANQKLDAEGIDHVFGLLRPRFLVWVIQVSSGKNKRRTYYRRLSKSELAVVKKPYRRRRYYRYIPLIAVTRKVSDKQIEKKIFNIGQKYKPIFENRNAPSHLRVLLLAFIAAHDIQIPRTLLENTP